MRTIWVLRLAASTGRQLGMQVMVSLAGELDIVSAPRHDGPRTVSRAGSRDPVIHDAPRC